MREANQTDRPCPKCGSALVLVGAGILLGVACNVCGYDSLGFSIGAVVGSPERPPVPELDQKVALEIMGWRRHVVNPGATGPARMSPEWWLRGDVSITAAGNFLSALSAGSGTCYATRPPAYSTEISAAWKVVEELKRRGFKWVFGDCTARPRTEEDIDHGHTHGAIAMVLKACNSERSFNGFFADAMPEAICKAALCAVGEIPRRTDGPNE